jgi:2,3-bisphosphoglycerate-dependent phosphoglycerate mutase
MKTCLCLVRHAQSLPFPHQPESDWVLSPVGIEQARGLVPILKRHGVQKVYSSPYVRCRETLRPFAEAHGIELAIHEGLRERRIAGQRLRRS